jgi:hypothetical protein
MLRFAATSAVFAVFAFSRPSMPAADKLDFRGRQPRNSWELNAMIMDAEPLKAQFAQRACEALDAGQAVIGIVGTIPGPIGVAADLTNAAISSARGDQAGAALSLAAVALPFMKSGARPASPIRPRTWPYPDDVIDLAKNYGRDLRPMWDAMGDIPRYRPEIPDVVWRGRSGPRDPMDMIDGLRGADPTQRSLFRAVNGTSGKYGSNWVHMSKRQDLAQGYARQDGYLYEINTRLIPHPVDVENLILVNRALRERARELGVAGFQNRWGRHLGEAEVAATYVPPEAIINVYRVDGSGVTLVP